MWIIPSEVTDALRGISGALGGNQPGVDDEDDAWVDPGPEDDAFADTSLQDPAQALAEARGQAGQASAEATEGASPSSRRYQAPARPGLDDTVARHSGAAGAPRPLRHRGAAHPRLRPPGRCRRSPGRAGRAGPPVQPRASRLADPAAYRCVRHPVTPV